MKVKPGFEIIDKYLRDNDCSLISTEEDIRGKIKISFTCFCGKTDVKYFNSFKKNPYCCECAKKSFLKKMSNSYFKVFEFIKENNCELLTEENGYINNRSNLSIRCNCGKVFETCFANFKGENKRACRECIVKRIRSNSKNKDSIKIIRTSREYILWRDFVFKRDGFSCKCCGDKSGGNINAHHIKNFSSFEEGRFNVDNGITLCDKCHNPNIRGSFHWVYGTRENNMEQLTEYINFHSVESNDKTVLKKIKNGKTSIYFGVCRDSARNKWVARITLKSGKRKNLGRFSKEFDAAIAYNQASIIEWGVNAVLNNI